MKDIYDDIAENMCASLSTGDEELYAEVERREYDMKHIDQDDAVHIRFSISAKKVKKNKELYICYFKNMFNEITGQDVDVTMLNNVGPMKITPVIYLKICTYQIDIKKFLRLIMCLLSSKEIIEVEFNSGINHFRYSISRRDFFIHRTKTGRMLLYRQHIVALALDLAKPLIDSKHPNQNLNSDIPGMTTLKQHFINECIYTILNSSFIRASNYEEDILMYDIDKFFLPKKLNQLCWIRTTSQQFKKKNFYLRKNNSKEICLKLFQPSTSYTKIEPLYDEFLLKRVSDNITKMKIVNADIIAYQKNISTFILHFGFYYDADTGQGAFVVAEVLQKSHAAKPKILKELDNLIVER